MGQNSLRGGKSCVQHCVNSLQGPPFHTIIHSSPAAATSIELVNAHLKGSQISLGFFHMLSMSSSHVSPQYQAAAWREKPCSSRFQCAETFDCFNHVLVQCFSNFHISRSLLNSDSVQMEPNGPVRVHLVPFVHWVYWGDCGFLSLHFGGF